jgi:subtilase family serine protease
VKSFIAPRRRQIGAILFVAAIAVVGSLTAATTSNAAAPQSHPIVVQPDISTAQRYTGNPGSVTFGCQSRPIDGSHGARCYQPSQIQKAYGYSGLLASGVNGAGKTIAIIDAYANPYLANDLAIQDGILGLPAPPSFTQVAMPGTPVFDANDPNQVGWGEEETLDVLWAHAMAPGAAIVLVEAASNNDSDLLTATQYVVDNHVGDVISQSFGEAETCMDPSLLAQQHALFQQAANEGITSFASSGDSGASQFNCDGSAAILSASTPASDPNVTGVGGTTLNATTPDGNYVGETAWTEQLFGCNPPAVDFNDINCSGGGFSTIYGRPSWQASQVKAKGRGVPDVSYDAGVNGGVITHCGVCNLTIGQSPNALIFFIFGGTSAGSPQWAALTADADQMAGHDVGNINESLYKFGQAPPKAAVDFHDVTTGNNDVVEIGNQGYNTSSGWDPVTGLGTPNAANLLPALAKKN